MQRSVDRTAADPHGSCNDFGAFARLNAAHGADAHCFQRRVIQLASIIMTHAESESDSTCPVNKNVKLLMDGLIQPPCFHLRCPVFEYWSTHIGALVLFS